MTFKKQYLSIEIYFLFIMVSYDKFMFTTTYHNMNLLDNKGILIMNSGCHRKELNLIGRITTFLPTTWATSNWLAWINLSLYSNIFTPKVSLFEISQARHCLPFSSPFDICPSTILTWVNSNLRKKITHLIVKWIILLNKFIYI